MLFNLKVPPHKWRTTNGGLAHKKTDENTIDCLYNHFELIANDCILHSATKYATGEHE